MEKIKKLFKDKKNRYFLMSIFFVPIIVLLIIFSVKTVKEVKNVLSLVSDDAVAFVDNKHKIDGMNYVLRDNATEYQEQLFSELKEAIKADEVADNIVGLVVKNHVADFYTFSNKAAQYDVGGLYYLNADGRSDVYTSARDSIYKYLNNYIKEYGSDQLLEVENVEVSVSKSIDKYPITVETHHDDYDNDNEQAWVFEYETTNYDAWDVKATWNYKQGTTFSTSKWPTSQTFKVIFNNAENRYEIVRAGTFENTENSEGVKA